MLYLEYNIRVVKRMKKSLKYLMELTINKQYDEIKNYLSQLGSNLEKGIVFEEYIRELFEGNGWIAVRKGGRNDLGVDVLLSHPKTPNDVSFIVQAKNHTNPLNYDDTRIEIIKFEEKGSIKHKCNHFMIISLNGFVKSASNLKEYANLEGFDYIRKLIDGYDPNNKRNPEIELLPHNKIAYLNVKRILKSSNKASVMQPTGTGKSFIIVSALSDYISENKLVLAPSNFILENLKDKASWASKNTTFMTYSKAINLSEKELKKLSPSLIILDEFHRVGAEKWGAAVKKIIDLNPKAKKIGTSATPIRYLDNGRDMSIELFGKENISSDMNLSEAIVKKILPMPKYVTSLYTLKDEVTAMIEKINKSENEISEKSDLLKQLNDISISWEKTHGVPEILKKHVTKNQKKFIIFCKDKEHLSEMEWVVEKWFRKAGFKEKISKHRVISGDPYYKEELESFKSNKRGLSFLFCIDMLNEGLHIDEVDVAILLRPTSSGNVFYQQIGRVLDVDKKSKPLIIDLVNNFSNVEARTLYLQLERELEMENKKRENLGLNNVDIPITIIDETLDIQELLRLIESKLTTSWDVMYDDLINFKSTHGHLEIPKRLDVENNLGYWVQTQRQMYKKGRLSKERIDKLNKIGFIWDTFEASWEEKFQELKNYIKQNNHMRFSKALVKESGLPNWCFDQKKKHKKGTLSQEKYDKLNSIGFVWDPWQTCYDELLQYKEENNDVNVPVNYRGENKLGNWISSQRKAYSKGKLSPKKVKLLEDIGFIFNIVDNYWDTMYLRLADFQKRHGNCDISKEFDKELYTWVRTQRPNLKNGKLSEEKIVRLKAIGFSSDVLVDKWNHMFSELEKYYKKYGNSKVPKTYADQNELGKWVLAQRRQFKEEKLSDERIKRLNTLDFVWDPFENLWAIRYEELNEYFNVNGHSDAPMKIKGKNFSLGSWAYNQRKDRLDGKLSFEKIEKLNNLNFSWKIKEISKTNT